MKILLIHPRLSVKGGGERVAIHSILAATRAGHEVTLLTEEFDETSFEDFFGCNGLFDKVNRCYYPAFRPMLGSRLLLYQRLAYHRSRIKKSTRNGGFDLVLSTQDIGYVPSTSVPVVQYCYFPEYFSHIQGNSPSPIWRLYYRPASSYYKTRVRRVETLLSVSNYTAKFVKEKWSRDSLTVYPPCPVEDYARFAEMHERENLVLTVGRIVPEKRFDAFVELAKMVPDTGFVAVGSVSNEARGYYEQLKEKSPENFSFVLSPLRRVKEILGRAMAYVHCAEGEHFGITIVEGMAAGCVPVVHDSGGPVEIVTPDVGFRWRDLDSAAKQIKMLADNDSLREKFSSNACSRAKRFDAETFELEMQRVLRIPERVH